MKKNYVLLFSVFTLVASFLSFWYKDVLFNHFFVLGILPLIFSVLAILVSLILSIVFLIRNPSVLKNYASLFITFIAIFLLFHFPFTMAKVNLELQLFDKQRNQVIEMVKNGEIVPDHFRIAKLPFMLSHTSSDGTICVYQNDEEQVVSFWVFRGMLSGSVELIYSSLDETLIYENLMGEFVSSAEELKEHWYLVETDY